MPVPNRAGERIGLSVKRMATITEAKAASQPRMVKKTSAVGRDDGGVIEFQNTPWRSPNVARMTTAIPIDHGRPNLIRKNPTNSKAPVRGGKADHEKRVRGFTATRSRDLRPWLPARLRDEELEP
jgi:hypothetical protein